MNGKKLASSKIRVSRRSHSNLIQQKEPIDVNSRRRSSRIVGGNRKEEEENNAATKIGDEKKVEDFNVEVLTGCHDRENNRKALKRKGILKLQETHHFSTTQSARYQCIGCNKGFQKEKDKQEHELNCERNKRQSRLECCFCDLPCDTPKDLRAHENKHRPIKKATSFNDGYVCLKCKKTFDSAFSLKIHTQSDHKIDAKPESCVNRESIGMIEGNGLSPKLIDVSKQSQYGKESKKDTTRKGLLTVEIDANDFVEKDKPFICLQCGSRYVYEKSKIKHELKYHGTSTAVSQHSREENNDRQTETGQVSDQNESLAGVSNVDKVEFHNGANPENTVKNDNNNVTPVNTMKEEVDCSLPPTEIPADSLPVTDTQLSARSPQIRNPIIKKKCIGCDKVFDGPKERDEHELDCGLNYFNRKFNCMFCDHPFDKPKTLRKHENKHRPARKTKKYKNRCVCIECNKTFDAIYSLRVHMKKFHRKGHAVPFENKPFQCSICNSRFKYENSKYKHEMRYHNADSDQTMSDGNDALPNVNDVSNSDGVPAECKLENCDRELMGDRMMKEERNGNLCSEQNSGIPNENKLINPVCNKLEDDTNVDVLLTNPIAAGVEVDETDKISCPRRKRKAKQAVEKKPKKQRTGPFVCNNCEAKFNSPQGLWLHSYHQNMRTKRLSCIGCKKSFKSDKDTEDHELKCNLNHNEYDFNCMFCDEAFATPKLLRNHEQMHRPRRRTKNHKCVCIACRKPFESVHSLKVHIRECRRNNVKMENGEMDREPDRERNQTMEEMKSCFVWLKDIGDGTTKKGKGVRKCRRNKSTRTQAADRIVTSAESQMGSDGECGADLNNCNVDVRDERNCNTGVDDKLGDSGECQVEHFKPEFSDLVEVPAYLVETDLTNQEGKMQAGATGSFQCGKCSSNFDSYEKLRYHSYSHRRRTKRMFCIGCRVGFEQSNDRDRHELECDVNLTNRQFNCIFCELPFVSPQTLRNHEKKHRPPKRYKRYKHMCLCAECDRAFDAVFTLKVHIRHMHRGSKEKVRIKEEVQDVNFESDLTFEEYKFDGDLKVETFH